MPKSLDSRVPNVTDRVADLAHEVRAGIEWRVRSAAFRTYREFLYRLAAVSRHLHDKTEFIGVTGSAGKTTAKDLIAHVLERDGRIGRKVNGTFNGSYDVARLILSTRKSDAYCVGEIAITNEGGIDLPLALFRPTVGVVTNVGGEHVATYRDLDGIATEKGKLVSSLPPTGLAVLNADDARVRAMRDRFAGRVVTYGVHPEAVVRATDVSASWPERLSFSVSHAGQRLQVQTRLCGAHWMPVVLAALATGVGMGVPLATAVSAVGEVEPFEGRMSSVQLEDGVTFIRDDWKAPVWSIENAFDFMRDARAARKIVVLGTLSDYSGPNRPRYVKAARQALGFADLVVFVGPRASASLRAKRRDQENLFAFPSLDRASAFLSDYLRTGDLVLLKGSIRTDHLERLVIARTATVKCWRTGCGRGYFCHQCSLLKTPDDRSLVPPAVAPGAPADEDARDERVAASALAEKPVDLPSRDGVTATSHATPTLVLGLGNAGERYEGTRHNVGQLTIDLLADRLGGAWTSHGDVATVLSTERNGHPVLLVKLAGMMNHSGSKFQRVAEALALPLRNCIVVHDDLDLPLGMVRAKHRGGDGGHRGIQSIIETFQDDRFRRVKVGIGKPEEAEPIEDYVLAAFPAEQLATLENALAMAADRVFDLIREELAAPNPADDRLRRTSSELGGTHTCSGIR